MLTEANKSNFTKMEIEGVDKARALHRGIGYPNYRKYLWLLQHNMIKGSKVTLDDVKRLLHIYREDQAMIKGKTVKRKQSSIKCWDPIKLPNQILNKHSRVHLMVDYMLVQGIQFLTTISHELQYRTVEVLPITYKKRSQER